MAFYTFSALSSTYVDVTWGVDGDPRKYIGSFMDDTRCWNVHSVWFQVVHLLDFVFTEEGDLEGRQRMATPIPDKAEAEARWEEIKGLDTYDDL